MRPVRPAAPATLGLTLLLGACGGGRTRIVTAAENQTPVRVVSGAGSRASALNVVSTSRALVDRVTVSADSAWRVLPAVYADLGVDYETLDQARRVIAHDALAVRRRLGRVPLSRYVACGAANGRDNADSFAVTMAVRTQVVPDSAGAAVVSTVSATARSLLFNSGDVACSSTQFLEDRIAALVKEKTGG